MDVAAAAAAACGVADGPGQFLSAGEAGSRQKNSCARCNF